MILDEHHANAFQLFAKPLQKLEKKFNKAGTAIILHAFAAPRGIKMVRLLTKDQWKNKLICIEWASPAQAVKIVEQAINAAINGQYAVCVR